MGSNPWWKLVRAVSSELEREHNLAAKKSWFARIWVKKFMKTSRAEAEMSFKNGTRELGAPGSGTGLLVALRFSAELNADELRESISGSNRVYRRSSSQLFLTSWMALYRVAKVFLSSVRKQSTRFLCAISPQRVSLAERAADIKLLCSLILVFARLRS
jgi:hypothetical protein